MAQTTVKHIQSNAYTSAMASGLIINGPSPDGFIHVTFWREGMRLTEEQFEQELFHHEGVQVAKMTPQGNTVEHFREDVSTMIIPVPKLSEFCDALCKMRDALGKAEQARDLFMAQDLHVAAADPAAS
ncbi:MULTISPECIES: hypothetical protein [Stenotrophomonas]|uniref:hypothetical protein n=1 Tax=Stenotrophomonas TaxID=40323 RepID=UPI0015F7DC32|nr:MULTISPECIES: hypothetical protein [Stenotrophomonas]MBB1135056.1 hypothetical protein [Stenotrophomonas sp. I18B00994]MCU1093893.1 hypothetical protein [Stenotrophomonas maltophilia]HEI8112374.1 hypothetical protein [Stenotrophomonas maltophilia]HEL4835296.1 hypothetical protein [Stenotrophomonas maltophilia]